MSENVINERGSQFIETSHDSVLRQEKHERKLMPKPTILTFVASYLPGYKSGGPVRSISNMVRFLGDEFDFKIITADRDKFDKQPYANVNINEWNDINEASVFYATAPRINGFKLARLLQRNNYDIVYLNSFFNFGYAIIPLLLRRLGMVPKHPVVLAPRGEFSPGALGIRKFKKSLFIIFSKLIKLHQDVTWQASNLMELEYIKSTMGIHENNIIVAANFSANDLLTPESISDYLPQAPTPVCIAFLSRISPKKNLDFALEILKRTTCEIIFNIYGEADDELYTNKCKSLASTMPKNVTVNFCGPIKHEYVMITYAKHHLFFLPTKGENFGHAIIESLCSGLPALISDQTPWQDLEGKNVGWVRPLSEPEKFVEVIERFAVTETKERIVQRKNAIDYARNWINDPKTKDANRSLFLHALSGAKMVADPAGLN